MRSAPVPPSYVGSRCSPYTLSCLHRGCGWVVWPCDLFSEGELIAAVDLWAARANPTKPDVKPSTEQRLLARHITPSVLRGGVVEDPNGPATPSPPPKPKGPRLEVRYSKRDKWKREHGIFAKSKEIGVEDYALPKGLKVVRGCVVCVRVCEVYRVDGGAACRDTQQHAQVHWLMLVMSMLADPWLPC